MTSVLLPLPETPVTHTNPPSGKATSIPFRLFSRAPFTTMARSARSGRRLVGTVMPRRPER